MLKMNRQSKKVTPKVVDGTVRKKNRHALTPTYWNTKQPIPVIDKEDPGPGYKHFLTKKDVLNFIDIIPNWEELSKSLNGILLSRGDTTAEGLHSAHYGVIAICAWPRNMWVEYTTEAYEEHKNIFERLDVECEKKKEYYICKFNEKSIRAFQLLHIFLHELGHHHDKMTTKKKRQCGRGELYAEQYALKNESIIWDKYFEKYGI